MLSMGEMVCALAAVFSLVGLQNASSRPAQSPPVDSPTNVVLEYMAMAEDGRQASPRTCPELARIAADVPAAHIPLHLKRYSMV